MSVKKDYASYNIHTQYSLLFKTLVQLPTICQDTDDEGCTYYYSYKQKDNITNIYVVENKGTVMEMLNDLNPIW